MGRDEGCRYHSIDVWGFILSALYGASNDRHLLYTNTRWCSLIGTPVSSGQAIITSHRNSPMHITKYGSTLYIGMTMVPYHHSANFTNRCFSFNMTDIVKIHLLSKNQLITCLGKGLNKKGLFSEFSFIFFFVFDFSKCNSITEQDQTMKLSRDMYFMNPACNIIFKIL